MRNKIYKVLEKIKSKSNTESILIVGSSKNIFDKDYKLNNINDIDLFIFTNSGENQVREVKKICDISFDINYFPKKIVLEYINKKEYFFLKEMTNPTIIYDKNNEIKNIINICKEKFKEGPKKLNVKEKELLISNIKSQILDLKDKYKYETFEYNFLVNLTLKEIIICYLKVNQKWVVKDKKLLKNIDDTEVLSLIKHMNYKNSYNTLEKIYEKLLGRAFYDR